MRFTLLFVDDTLPGFGVYRTSGGKTVYAVEYEKGGKPVTEVVGKVSKISLKKARKVAAKFLAATKPIQPKQAEPAPPPKRRRRRRSIVTDVLTVTVPEVRAQVPLSDERKLPRRLLVFPELKSTRSIPYGRRQIDRLEAAGKFPKRVAIGARRVGWVESEIDEYVEKMIASRSMAVGTLGSAKREK
jgi:predicted DNA-binding transcriptional regulator AlpA